MSHPTCAHKKKVVMQSFAKQPSSNANNFCFFPNDTKLSRNERNRFFSKKMKLNYSVLSIWQKNWKLKKLVSTSYQYFSVTTNQNWTNPPKIPTSTNNDAKGDRKIGSKRRKHYSLIIIFVIFYAHCNLYICCILCPL